MTESDPATDFAEFLGNQLEGKSRGFVLRDPAYDQPGSGQVDGVDQGAEVDTSSPEQAVKTALRKYALPKEDAELLQGVPADKVEAAAARLAANLDPNRPRRPQPVPGQGQTGGVNTNRTGFEGLKDALNPAAARADGQGAYQEIR
jgi:hypothetical protein